MLRACRRVLRPEGRIAFFAVVIPDDVPAEVTAEVADGLPGFAGADAPYPEMLETAGFIAITEEDVTDAYEVTSARWQDVSLALGDQLREALGADVFDEKQENRGRSLEAIRAVRPTATPPSPGGIRLPYISPATWRGWALRILAVAGVLAFIGLRLRRHQ